MDKYYSNNRAVQMLIAIMKENGIRKVVASPGTTNIEFVGSIENDPFFEIYSSVDERSAAYIACGLAQQSGEPVALSCTGATASRNYFPGLTEAFYRQIPILAITSTQPIGRTDSYSPQFIDRSVQPEDTVKLSVQIGIIHDEEEEWTANTLINKAILELSHNGNGPVHINLTTTYSKDFSIKGLPKTRVIKRIVEGGSFPKIETGRIAIFVGSHLPWNDKLTRAVEEFCEKYDACVITDHTGNYRGKYKINAPLICSQDLYSCACRNCNLIIHLGCVSGAEIGLFCNNVWRVNPDGVIRDTFKKLTHIFEMSELTFFQYYNAISENKEEDKTEITYYLEWKREEESIWSLECNLPFSNVWIAQQTISKLPSNSNLYLGILNSLRSWDYFRLENSINVFANTGGFGIDGMISSLLGTALADPDRICFGVLGDLSFFYDMNSLGNRHFPSNIRLLVVNNGKGTEFTNYNHQGALFGEDANKYIAASGHFGNKSEDLIKDYVENLGYKYLCAHNKEEYLKSVQMFVSMDLKDRPIIFEVFTNSEDESDAIKKMRTLIRDTKGATKQIVKNIIGQKGVYTIKKIMGKE